MGESLKPLIDRLLHAVGGDGGPPGDAQLLDRFVQTHDEAAFESLLWRHGPMVLGLCRRLLCHRHDAEDAFQAVFLVFFRKANTIGRRECVPGWLYRVAYRVALKAAIGVGTDKPGALLYELLGVTIVYTGVHVNGDREVFFVTRVKTTPLSKIAALFLPDWSRRR
jgi:hypothetical protein